MVAVIFLLSVGDCVSMKPIMELASRVLVSIISEHQGTLGPRARIASDTVYILFVITRKTKQDKVD